MKIKHFTLICGALLLVSCAHPPRINEAHSNLISAKLDKVSFLDVFNMYQKIGFGPFLTDDSIPKAELEKILVSMEVKDVTRDEFLQHAATAAKLKIEITSNGCFRVTRSPP
jgi:hypothetical protein